VDHQLCYSASGTHFKIPAGVRLINQFSPRRLRAGDQPHRGDPLQPDGGRHQPVRQRDPDPQPAQPSCVPSWKSLTGPPGKTPKTPPGLNHFTCYPVKVASGGYAPPRVMLQDEFASGPVPATVNPVPVELCLPTEKIVGTRVFKIINPAMHLLCFPVSPTPIVPKIWDENQFGTSAVAIRATNWLCPPSTKQIAQTGATCVQGWPGNALARAVIGWLAS